MGAHIPDWREERVARREILNVVQAVQHMVRRQHGHGEGLDPSSGVHGVAAAIHARANARTQRDRGGEDALPRLAMLLKDELHAREVQLAHTQVAWRSADVHTRPGWLPRDPTWCVTCCESAAARR